MGKSARLQAAIDALHGLSRDELEELRRVIGVRLTEGFLDTEPNGHIEYKFIRRGDKTYGPYKYRRVWVDGKLTSRYEGKAQPGEYEEWKKRHD